LRFRRGGGRSWIFQRKVDGADCRLTLGPYPDMSAKVARGLAQAKQAEIWQGKDPRAAKREAKAKQLAQIPLRTAIDNYLAAKQSKLRPLSFSETRRYLMKDWKSLHDWPIEEIQIPQVATILDRLEKAGPVAAARSRSNLSALFGWAMGHGYVKHNPVIGTINPDTGVPRDRVLSDRELATVWNNCQGDDDYSRIIRLLILTGARRTEVGAMTWQELNFEDRTWTIPGERTKNKKPHALPLSHAFWAIIETIERRPGREHLFGYSGRGYQNWTEPKSALDRHCQIPAWRHHDLRRTVATKLAESPPKGLGVKPHVVEALLNHISGHKAGVAGIYNRASYQPEVKTALAMWADYLHANIAGSERKIIPMLAKAEES